MTTLERDLFRGCEEQRARDHDEKENDELLSNLRQVHIKDITDTLLFLAFDCNAVPLNTFFHV